MKSTLSAVAALALALIFFACSAVSLVLSWASWPFDQLKSVCADRAQQLARSLRKHTF
jgi:hypothetical protein